MGNDWARDILDVDATAVLLKACMLLIESLYQEHTVGLRSLYAFLEVYESPSFCWQQVQQFLIFFNSHCVFSQSESKRWSHSYLTPNGHKRDDFQVHLE